MFDSNNDGWDHINIYSKGQTVLGRWLSNFTEEPFVCDDGVFNSIEGYWYWLGCNHVDKNRLRHLSGFQAKKLGRELGATEWLETEILKNKIKRAMEIKLEVNPQMNEIFKKSDLPFAHYYCYGGKVVEVKEGQWIVDHWEYLRKL